MSITKKERKVKPTELVVKKTEKHYNKNNTGQLGAYKKGVKDMEKNSKTYQKYLNILQEELVPALGCTEPIAIAYAAAHAVELLGAFPERLVVACSGNIIKNAKSVIVPTTGNLKGIEASAILGAVGGDPKLGLEVLAPIRPEHIAQTRRLLAAGICKMELLAGTANLHIIITAIRGKESAAVEILNEHTNIVRMLKNGAPVFQKPQDRLAEESNGSDMSLAEIFHFANSVDMPDVEEIIGRQVVYNSRIAEEGLQNDYGARVGRTLLETFGDDIRTRARAYAAAGSDARMGGCTLPVVINSGSGNQGMTVSLPVIQYAHFLHAPKELLYRALVMSNLTAIHQKMGIGRLSAYCGAVSAATGSAAGIAYINGGGLELIAKTVINTLANVSGIVCDGAKPSCAAKIASAVDAALIGYHMALKDRVFHSGEGIVKDSVEETISSVCKLGREGMRQTDNKILEIMVGL